MTNNNLTQPIAGRQTHVPPTNMQAPSQKPKELHLNVAAISGRIYLSEIVQPGVMSDSKQYMTDEVIRTTMEWMLQNKLQKVSLQDSNHTLFYTSDPEKIKQIRAILGLSKSEEV